MHASCTRPHLRSDPASEPCPPATLTLLPANPQDRSRSRPAMGSRTLDARTDARQGAAHSRKDHRQFPETPSPRRIDADTVLPTLREPAIAVAPESSRAATAHLEVVFTQLAVVGQQPAKAHREMGRLMATLPAASEPTEEQPGTQPQRDLEILRSLPAVGRIVFATLLAEAHDRLHRLARPLARPCPRPAVRSVADRLVTVVCAMLKNRTVFDPSLRIQDRATWSSELNRNKLVSDDRRRSTSGPLHVVRSRPTFSIACRFRLQPPRPKRESKWLPRPGVQPKAGGAILRGVRVGSASALGFPPRGLEAAFVGKPRALADLTLRV